ncbi:hypothetical protein PTKIN_Ptkin08bG0020400 [Pterospermum kingtungense]
MGSCVEYSSSSSLPQTPNQTQPESPSGLNSDNPLSAFYLSGTEEEEERLVEWLKNVTLDQENGENYQYPLRPHAEDCSFYLKTGKCKFGLNCKFNHPVERVQYGKARSNLEKYEFPPPELNSLGLPIGMLVKNCSYYMRTGSCAYGSNCKFNHPEPSAAEGSNSSSPAPSGFGGHSSGNYNAESNALPSSSSSSSSSSKPELNVLGLPIRMRVKDCPYYMRTGSCGYGSNCIFNHPDLTAEGSNSKFHHPKAGPSKPTGFSSAGLPLRPDRKICWSYEKVGICKYGRSCCFHHPEDFDDSL